LRAVRRAFQDVAFLDDRVVRVNAEAKESRPYAADERAFKPDVDRVATSSETSVENCRLV
jgi:hypothetical protein